MGKKAQTHMTGHAAALGFSGGLAGGIAKTAVAPLERVKLLMQTGESQGVTVTLRKVVHHEGFGALWRGNTVNVMRMVPSKCVLLSCSDLYKDALGLTHMSAFAQGGIAGAFAGATAALCTYPLDLARTRMAGMLHSGGMASTQHGALATLVNIYQNEGVRALYRGASPTVLGALPYEGIKFGTYDLLKRHARPLPSGSAPGERSSGGPLWRACCGATAAMIAHVLTYPNDTIRRRLQLQGARKSTMPYDGWVDCLRKIVRYEGWVTLYRGLGVTMLRAVPNTGLQFAVYEACKDLIQHMELSRI